MQTNLLPQGNNKVAAQDKATLLLKKDTKTSRDKQGQIELQS